MEESKCLLCKGKATTSDRRLYGQTLHKDGVAVHQYCLYFAAGLFQRGEEDEGIHGFLMADIRKEVSRASRLTCRYCRRKGAPTGCVVSSCRQTCHAPCGMNNGFLFRHEGQFQAYCPVHRPFQKPTLVNAALSKTEACHLCTEELKATPRGCLSILVCPVCVTGFHRKCLQQRAWACGSRHFRCSVCGDREGFAREMLRMGLEIPEEDTEQSETEAECKADKCLCPDGRSFYTRMSKYRMKTCHHCGTVLGHMVCIKRQTCSACPSPPSTPPSVTSSELTSVLPLPKVNRHCVQEVGVVKSTDAPPTTKCDCIICRTRSLTPDSPLSKPLPPTMTLPTEGQHSSSPPPSSSSSSSQVKPSPFPPSPRLTSPVTTRPPSSLLPPQPHISTPLHNHTPNTLFSSSLPHHLPSVSPALSMIVQPPTPAGVSPLSLTPSHSLSRSPNSSACSGPPVTGAQYSLPVFPYFPPHNPYVNFIQQYFQWSGVHMRPLLGQQPSLSQSTSLVRRPLPLPVASSPSPNSTGALSSLSLHNHHGSPPHSSLNSLFTPPHSISNHETTPSSETTPPSVESSSVCSYFDYVDIPCEMTPTTSSPWGQTHKKGQSTLYSMTSSELRTVSNFGNSRTSNSRTASSTRTIPNTSLEMRKDNVRPHLVKPHPQRAGQLYTSHTPSVTDKMATTQHYGRVSVMASSQQRCTVPASYKMPTPTRHHNTKIHVGGAGTLLRELMKDGGTRGGGTRRLETHLMVRRPVTTKAHDTVIRVPLNHLTRTTRARLQNRRRDRDDCEMSEFLQSKGLPVKRPRLVLHRINHQVNQ